MIPVVILAGGLATRLLPATAKIPKSMLMIAGKPFIQHQLELLRKNSVTEVVICAGHLSEMIRDFVGTGYNLGLNVSYSIDGKAPLGTAGAIKKALPLLGKKFFTLYGDSYLTCDFLAVLSSFEKSQQLALMTVYKNDSQFGKSNVDMAGGKIIAYDKKSNNPRMQYIDYGLGVFSRDAFSWLAEGQSADLATLYQDLAAVNALAAHEVPDRFYEIGSFAGLAETEKLLCDTSAT